VSGRTVEGQSTFTGGRQPGYGAVGQRTLGGTQGYGAPSYGVTASGVTTGMGYGQTTGAALGPRSYGGTGTTVGWGGVSGYGTTSGYGGAGTGLNVGGGRQSGYIGYGPGEERSV